MAFDAGTVQATLDLDRTPFQQGMDLAREQGEDFDGKTFSANLDIDATRAEAELQRFRDQLAQLNTNGSGPRIELDTMSATAKIRELLTLLERLDTYRAEPTVDIDISGASRQLVELLAQLERIDDFRANPRIDLDGYALARAQIASLQHQLNQLDRTRANPSVAGINNIGAASQRAGGHAGSLRGRLIGLAVALSPGLIPVAGAATAGLVTLGGALTAAGVGAGLFGGAMLTNLGPVKDAIKNFDEQGLAAFDHLDEGQKKVATGAILLKTQWKQAADEVRPQTYAVATSVLGGLSNALQGLRPVLRVAADAFVDLSAGFERATKGQTFKDFTAFLERNAGGAIRGFGKVLGDLSATMFRVFEAFEPLMRPAGKALLDFTGNLRKSAEGLKTNDGFQRFLQYIRDTAPVVRDALKSLWDGFTALVSALAPLGPPLLRFVGFIGDLVKTVSDSKGFRNFIDSLGKLIDAVVRTAKEIIKSDEFKRFIDNLGNALAKIADFFTKWVSNKQNVEDMKKAFGTLADVLDKVGKVVGFLSDHIGKVREAFKLFSTIVNPFGTALNIVKSAVGGIGDVIGKIPGIVGKIPGALAGANVAIGRWVVNAGGAIGRFVTSTNASIGRWVVSAGGAIGRFASSTAGTLVRWQTQAANAIGRFASSAVNTLARWQGQAVSAVGRFANSAVSTLARFQNNAVSTIGRFANSGAAAINRFASQGVSAVGRFASQAALGIANATSRMVSALGSGIGRMVSLMGSLPGRIAGALGNTASLLFNAGRNIIGGLISGIASRIGELRSQIGGLTGMIRSFLPFSPAKQGPLSGSGSPNIAGAKIASMIAEGLESGQDRVAMASQRLMGNVRFGAARPAFAGAGAPAAAAGRAGDTFNYYGVGWTELAKQQAETQRQRDFLMGG